MTRQLSIRPTPAGLVPRTAMVMAAGIGKRMRPLTATRPKPLVSVAGKPLIDHVFDRLVAAGVERAVVNVHYLADQLEAHLRDRFPEIEIVISDERDQLLETGGGLVKARPLLGDAPVLVVNSDNLWVDGPVDAIRLLASRWDEAAMDALLLMVPLARAQSSGAGRFPSGGRWPDHRAAQARPGRALLLPGSRSCIPGSSPMRPRGLRPTCSGTARSRPGAPMARCIRGCGSMSARRAPYRRRN
jgi:MurNAc alpha-1-phosphate uridylyltransferase